MYVHGKNIYLLDYNQQVLNHQDDLLQNVPVIEIPVIKFTLQL